jgi:hypothetical protein
MESIRKRANRNIESFSIRTPRVSRTSRKTSKISKNTKRNTQQIYYRILDKITTRKPRRKDTLNYIAFKVQNNNNSSISTIKQFLKHILISVKEINFLRNDVGFLLTDMYRNDHSVDITTPIDDGCIFYVWVYLPFENPNSLPQDIKSTIFAFDLAYVKRKMTTAECDHVINVLKKEVNVHIYARQLFEKVVLPFSIHVVP